MNGGAVLLPCAPCHMGLKDIVKLSLKGQFESC